MTSDGGHVYLEPFRKPRTDRRPDRAAAPGGELSQGALAAARHASVGHPEGLAQPRARRAGRRAADGPDASVPVEPALLRRRRPRGVPRAAGRTGGTVQGANLGPPSAAPASRQAAVTLSERSMLGAVALAVGAALHRV